MLRYSLEITRANSCRLNQFGLVQFSLEDSLGVFRRKFKQTSDSLLSRFRPVSFAFRERTQQIRTSGKERNDLFVQLPADTPFCFGLEPFRRLQVHAVASFLGVPGSGCSPPPYSILGHLRRVVRSHSGITGGVSAASEFFEFLQFNSEWFFMVSAISIQELIMR